MPRTPWTKKRAPISTRAIDHPGRVMPYRSQDIEILDYDPTASRSSLERFLATYLKLFNDPRWLHHTSLTLRPHQEDAVRKCLETADKSEHRFLTAVDTDGRIVGIQVVAIDADDGYELQHITVRHEMRRRGIARALVKHAVGLATTLGYRAADTQVFVDNVPMLTLLVQSGFVPVDMLHNVRADGCDMLWLRRTLDSPHCPFALVRDDRTMTPATATDDRRLIGRIPREKVAITECCPGRDPGLLDSMIPACVELLNDADGANRMSLTLKPWDHAAVRDWLTDGGEYQCLIAVDAQKRIVGVQIASVDQEGFVLEALGVSPSVRRRGIGYQLVSRAIATAAERGFRAVDARVFVDNPPIIVLLLGAGFIPVNLRFRARADGCDVLWMRKYLS